VSELKDLRFIGFDADQTLWDFVGGMQRALGAVVTEIEQLSTRRPTGMTIERLQQLRTEIAEQRPGELDLARVRWFAFEQALREVELPTEGLTQRLYDVYFANRSRPSDLFAGTNETLTRLQSAGYRLGVMTNGNADLDEYGVVDVFDFVVRAEEVGHAKPDERFFKTAQERAGLNPHQMLLVGDNLVDDVQGAQDVGWHAVWLNQGGLTVPDWVQRPSIASLTDLLQVLG
jgi:FMN hydrolase / 5-amino-6-(5-phospho-D-ribitylamino)uracil phosphatase